MKNILTYTEFLATAIQLPKHLAADAVGLSDNDIQSPFGIVFHSLCYMEYDPELPNEYMRYSTVIGRCDFYGATKEDVAKYLYLWYLEEHCVSNYSQEDREKMIAEHSAAYNIPESWYW